MFANMILASEFWTNVGDALGNLWQSTGIYSADWTNFVMIAISFVLFYLAIVKKFEPLLMLPIAFGMFIVNVPGVYHVLFGTKGYVLTNSDTNVEVARWSVDELKNMFFNGAETITLEQVSQNAIFSQNTNALSSLLEAFAV